MNDDPKIALNRALHRALALGLLLTCAWAASGEDDLLPPEEAFKFSARLVDADNLEVRYAIADGYYMYRDKFKFSARPDTVALGRPELPAGEVKDDEYFGKVETYRDEVVIRVPLDVKSGTAALTLDAVSQGCADVGVCYTPQKATAKLQLAALGDSTAAGSASDGGGALAKLKRLAQPEEDAQPEFLPPDQAFKVRLRAQDATTLVADLLPAKGYYLYRDKIAFSIAGGAGVTVTQLDLPAGERKDDPNFGITEVFHHPVQTRIGLERKPGSAQEITVQARYQGCADAGLCYPPERKTFSVTLAAMAAKGAVARDASPGAASTRNELPTAAVADRRAEAAVSRSFTESEDETSQIAQILKSGNFWPIVASFFGFGVLLAFTPCVLPMVPILSGIIVGRGSGMTRRHAFSLTGIYVLGMAITYALAGVAAGLSGTLLSNALQNPWVLTAFALLFVVLSLSMFGFYELQLPNALQSKLTGASNRMKGGTFWGVFAMGVLSALIVGPCVAAPLAGALLYINQTRDAVLGGSALFAMALGMGVPLLAVGVSAGTLLPKAGAWMQTVKSFFGVLLLGLAIWIISPIVPAVWTILLWACLLVCSAVYLHAIDPLPQNATGFRKLWKGVGVIALLLGAALLIGALSGSRDVLQPLTGLRGGAAVAESAHPQFQTVASTIDLDRALEQARGRPVMLDFYADWCVSCKEMERFTFTDARVRERMSRMLLLKADVTGNTPQDAELLRRFGLFGPPGTIFFAPNGEELRRARVIGFQPADRFAATLDVALPGS